MGIKTVGFDRFKDIKKLPILWEKGENLSSTAGVVTANVNSAKSSKSDQTSGIASNQSMNNSEGKGNTLQSDKQVVEQESSSESEQKGKTKLRSDDGAVASDLHDDKSDAGIADADAQLAEKRAIAEELKGVWEERTGVKVTLYDRVEDVTDPDAQAQLKQGVGVAGWFNAATGEVGVYIPNIKGCRDVERTIIHEVVGHLGIKGLLGEKGHAAFLDSVWRMMSGIEKELRMDM